MTFYSIKGGDDMASKRDHAKLRVRAETFPSVQVYQIRTTRFHPIMIHAITTSLVVRAHEKPMTKSENQ